MLIDFATSEQSHGDADRGGGWTNKTQQQSPPKHHHPHQFKQRIRQQRRSTPSPVLPLGTPVFVLGQVTCDSDDSSPQRSGIMKSGGSQGDLLVLSVESIKRPPFKTPASSKGSNHSMVQQQQQQPQPQLQQFHQLQQQYRQLQQQYKQLLQQQQLHNRQQQSNVQISTEGYYYYRCC